MKLQLESSGACCGFINHYNPPLEVDFYKEDDEEYILSVTGVPGMDVSGTSLEECIETLHETELCVHISLNKEYPSIIADHMKKILSHLTVDIPEGFVTVDGNEVKLLRDD